MSIPLTLARAVALLILPYRSEVVFRSLDGHLCRQDLAGWAELESAIRGSDEPIYRVDAAATCILDPQGREVVKVCPGRFWAFWRNAAPTLQEIHRDDPAAWHAWATQRPA